MAGPGCLHPGPGWRTRGPGTPVAPMLWPGAGSGGHLQDGAQDAGGVGRGQEEVGRLHGRAGPCHRVDSRDESRMSS